MISRSIPLWLLVAAACLVVATCLVAVACHTAPVAPGSPARSSNPAPRAPDQVLFLRISGGGAPLQVAVYRDDTTRRGVLTIGTAESAWTSRIFPMWKAATGDLVGDGDDELILGIWSRQRRHDEPQPHRTVWVLGWDGQRLYEEWRGSALARPLRDFAIVDLDGDGRDELLALESIGGRCLTAAYRWNGFGFTGLATSAVDCSARLTARPGCIEEATERGGRKPSVRCAALAAEPRELIWK